MPTINKLVSQWRQWINRNKTFTSHEMDELENHLLEEIDDLKQYEGLSEEEAFQKVVSVIGGREALDKEFVKSKPPGPKAVHWVKTHSLQIYSVLLLLIVFLVSDLVYSSFHFVDVYEPVSNNYEYKSSVNNSYALMTTFSELKPYFDIETTFRDSTKTITLYTKSYTNSTDTPLEMNAYDTYFGKGGGYIMFSDGERFTIDTSSTLTSRTLYSSNDIWETKAPNKMTTNALFFCRANLFNANYQFALDDKNQLWLEHYSKFTFYSPKTLLKPINVTKKQFIMDKSILESIKFYGRKEIQLPYVTYPEKMESNDFLLFKTINPNEVLLFQKEPNGVRTIRLQLFKLPNQKNPILAWDEVKLVRKPIHLWHKFTLSR